MKMRHNKFTLVELLVVICIASLLMGLVLPAFNRMVTGSAVDRLTSNLKIRLERTQSHAASERRHIALILPSGSDWTASDKDGKSRNGGSRMCIVATPGSDYSAEFKKWIPDEDWELPERGALLVYVSKDDPLDTVNNEVVLKNAIVKTGGSLARKEASLMTPETSGNDKPLKKITGYPGGDKDNCAIIYAPDGSVCSAGDIYLVIHEAMKTSDGSFVFPGGGVEFRNFRVLKINRLTGKVEYHR